MKNEFKWYRHKDGDIAFLIGVCFDGYYLFELNSSGAVQYFANLDEFTPLPECNGFNWEPEPKIEFGSIWECRETGFRAVVVPTQSGIRYTFRDGSGNITSENNFLENFKPVKQD